MVDSGSVAIADVKRDLHHLRLRFTFRLSMSSWPLHLRPELNRMLADIRRRLLQA